MGADPSVRNETGAWVRALMNIVGVEQTSGNEATNGESRRVRGGRNARRIKERRKKSRR
jgi:hypothetical protein